MLRSSTRVSRFLAVSALALGLALFAPAAGIAGDDDDPWDPAMSTSDTMDDHHAESRDPDSMLAESQDLDDNLGHSENLDDNLAKSEDPDDMVADSENLDSHIGESSNLADLPTDAPDDGYEKIVPASQADWGPTDNPRVLVARDKVVRAEKRAQRARTRYGDMMQANYPRGAARARIVDERDESEAALEEAQHTLQALGN
jgi:hypothetical protein